MSLLSVPLNVHVITALEEGASSLGDLRGAVGLPPPTTMRGHLRTLTELGILERSRSGAFPGVVSYALTRSGEDLLRLAYIVQAWLNLAPGQTLILGTLSAKSATKALVEGWSSTLIRALAARPLTLTALDCLIGNLNYPSLERRLSAMRMVGQIEPIATHGRGTPYTVTPWLRQAVAAIAAASRWEGTHTPDSSMVGRIDVEAMFLLAIPLVRLSSDVTGSCRLAVELGADRQLAGVMVGFANGEPVSYVADLSGSAVSGAVGTLAGWLDALLDARTTGLEVSGDCRLARAIIDGLHEGLCGRDLQVH
ncbi:MAG TPA: winged helix-turn-helix transcriptional regulator [Solirubrobacterales bacterium]|nr:winged helix-turn-helix transcriptional regulator [Solirubrobacterales bacterium]